MHLLFSIQVIRKPAVLLRRLRLLHSLLHFGLCIWNGQVKVLSQHILPLLFFDFLLVDLPHQFILNLQFSLAYLVLFRFDCQVLLLFLSLFLLFLQILFYDLIHFVCFAFASWLWSIFSGVQMHWT